MLKQGEPQCLAWPGPDQLQGTKRPSYSYSTSTGQLIANPPNFCCLQSLGSLTLIAPPMIEHCSGPWSTPLHSTPTKPTGQNPFSASFPNATKLSSIVDHTAHTCSHAYFAHCFSFCRPIALPSTPAFDCTHVASQAVTVHTLPNLPTLRSSHLHVSAWHPSQTAIFNCFCFDSNVFIWYPCEKHMCARPSHECSSTPDFL